jgi:hypothetical protein
MHNVSNEIIYRLLPSIGTILYFHPDTDSKDTVGTIHCISDRCLNLIRILSKHLIRNEQTIGSTVYFKTLHS